MDEQRNGQMKSLQHRIDQFLFNYRNTPTGVTEETPAQLFLSWKPRTMLSLLHPDIEQRMKEKLERTRQSANRRRGAWRDFEEGEDVLVQGLRPGEGEWLSGKVNKRDQGRHELYKRQLPEDGNEKKNPYRWMNLYLVALLLVGLGLLGCLFVLGFTSAKQSQDDTTTVYTIPSLSIPEISVDVVTRPSQLPRLHTTNASATTPPDGHHIPTPLRPSYDCSTCPCRSLAQRIREKLDYNVDPCQDFYKFVCNSFRGKSEFDNVLESIHFYNQLRLRIPHIPDSNQLSWQKAAGMYHACLNFAADYEPETKYLVEWLTSMGLDILNEKRLAKVNPGQMMVRSALEFGVPVVIKITFTPRTQLNNKRIMQIDYYEDYIEAQYFNKEPEDYMKFLLMYGVPPPYHIQYAAAIKGHADFLRFIASRELKGYYSKLVPIKRLGNSTKPNVTSDQWINYIMLYTDNTYHDGDYVFIRMPALYTLARIYNNMTKIGLNYLVAWKIFLHLVRFTEPYIFLHNTSASDACYEHVSAYMKLAVNSPFLQSEVGPYLVRQAKNMAGEIRNAYVRALHDSHWLSDDFRQAAAKKTIDIRFFVGSPGQDLDPNFVETLYKPYPDAPLDLKPLAPTWIKVVGLDTQYEWMYPAVPLFDETVRRPFYDRFSNAVIVPAASMLRPFMYRHGVAALNYGGLGTMIGQMIMGALDPQNIRSLYSNVTDPMGDVMREYTKRTLCLRKFRQSVNASGAVLDYENLGDFVGTKMAAFGCAAKTPMNPEEKCPFW
ncbi:hypothetical protein MTO96_026822 [Rhipicephalus appendiculatus]